ncbi:ATP-binding protein [Streptomyces millisiae]|uniref:BTAD domain-containing putative transcriptional regulator n=1 Tax=Streptomyces millisiae TaxID=3075542 RepID=A0ABU2LVQ6_9ACTN|nr:BTAD domain-containing putative transcriptional regulator [Streptomyces sp. DSM 44918]MDT0321659.1 BTAD domain-containing putative transcriptional regulator [Streptomyces sp. DSM 44918]
MTGMEFQLLGDVAVRDGSGRALPVPGVRVRALLALLLLHAPFAVSAGRILDELWADATAKDPAAALHTAVAKLRRALRATPPGPLLTGPAGYRIDLSGHSFDVADFEDELARARALDDPAARAAALRGALDRWPGSPLAGLPDLPFVTAERSRLAELRLAALEDGADSELAADPGPEHAAALAGVLRTAARRHPDRERLHALLVHALRASGRQAEALATYREVRAALRDRLGIEPGPELRAAQRAVLGDSARRARPAPRSSTAFLGRRTELARLTAGLTAARLTTVTGTPGVGKTALAHAAADAEQHRGAAVFRVDLVPCPPGELPWTVAEALGIDPGAAPPHLLFERLLPALGRGSRPLLLLDNCEHLRAEAADLTARLLAACPELRVLATSREPLGVPGEARFELSPMTAADAVRLFHDRLGRLSPSAARAAATPDVDAVCAAVDRVPLGIELVAPKATTSPLPEIARRLRAHGAVPGALRAAIELGYRRLTDPERAVLRAVSVFTAPFPTEAAEAVTGLPDTPAALARLAETSLLLFDPATARYRMLLPLRHFARAELARHDEEPAVRHRHARWVAALADHTADLMRGPTSRAAFATLRSVFAEVSACLDRLADGDPGQRRLAGRITTRLALYWLLSGRRAEGHRRLTDALAAADPDAPWYPEALAWCGWLGVNLHAADADADLLRRAVTAAVERTDPAATTLVGALALTAHVRQDRLAEARETADRTATALDERRHRWETGIWHLFHGELQVAEGSPRAALDSATLAGDLLADIDPHSTATADLVAGMAHERLGERAAAVRRWQRARRELAGLGADHEASYATAVLACAAVGDARWADAAALADELAGYARTSGEHFLLGKTATVRALLARRAHRDHDLAERLHRTAIEHYEADNRPECVAHELALLGAVAAERGEPVVARVRWERALRTADRSGRAHARVLPLRGLAALPDQPAAAHDLARALREAPPPRMTECPVHLTVADDAAPL